MHTALGIALGGTVLALWLYRPMALVAALALAFSAAVFFALWRLLALLASMDRPVLYVLTVAGLTVAGARALWELSFLLPPQGKPRR